MKDLIDTVLKQIEVGDCIEEDDIVNTDNKYKEIAGVDTREEYLDNVAEEYGVDNEAVHCLADILGESEDFDGLISMIDDFTWAGLM